MKGREEKGEKRKGRGLPRVGSRSHVRNPEKYSDHSRMWSFTFGAKMSWAEHKSDRSTLHCVQKKRV